MFFSHTDRSAVLLLLALAPMVTACASRADREIAMAPRPTQPWQLAATLAA